MRIHELDSQGRCRGAATPRLDAGADGERLPDSRTHCLAQGDCRPAQGGLRKPRFDELLLMARALGTTLDKLIPGGDDEVVELGDGAEVSPRWIREMLAGDFYTSRSRMRLMSGSRSMTP